jgi:hypothetical protein
MKEKKIESETTTIHRVTFLREATRADFVIDDLQAGKQDVRKVYRYIAYVTAISCIFNACSADSTTS